MDEIIPGQIRHDGLEGEECKETCYVILSKVANKNAWHCMWLDGVTAEYSNWDIEVDKIIGYMNPKTAKYLYG